MNSPDAFDDPPSCPGCGAMAGCCREYPQCVGNPEWKPPTEADGMMRFFRFVPVAIEGEPDAHRIHFIVGAQSFEVGPDYCESKEHAEWFASMIIKAMLNAVRQYEKRD